ncbi:hypothetical protein Ndes2526B_g09681 [Nannochloris sp. 'desiccata']|nr:putative Protein ROS1C [Chlorella desiccata (nom. nud.)]KAH7615840.1 putative Protein ROS1C [Chlorella desiccata (nom. nud.)]
MDQQGNKDTPAPEAIWDATVPELARATEPSVPNPAIYIPNPWMQYQNNSNFWNHLSLFLPVFQQAGFQLPTPTLQQQQQQPAAPFWPAAPVQTQESILKNPFYPIPALQSIGMFQGIPLLAPVEAEQPLAGAAASNLLTAGPGLPTSPSMLATPTKLDVPQRTSRRKRARILREGQLTMIVYGANEAMTWARRVTQFQNVMRSVLGDRRKTFTWSGSVTDSVVGAFLTQNVSDALSSRAYMEVASRWPAQHNGVSSSSSYILPSLSSSFTSSTATITLGDEADTVDWEAIRTVNINDLADAIRCRGMQTVLSTNIQSFLNHLRRYNLLKKGVRVAANGGFRGIETDVIATVDSILDEIVEKAQLNVEKEVDLVIGELIEGVEVNDNVNNIILDIEEGIDDSRLDSPNGPLRSLPSRSHISLAYEGEDEKKVEVVRDTQKYPPLQLTQEQQQEKALEAARLLSSEWLRDVPDDEARDFLMSINGLGRKSVACIMLLTLGKKEFPVDTNVGRICSRLGWIPLDAAESIEDLDDYAPEPEVHAYLRSRLLGFDAETLYELHYQMITLGKVFCSKHSPNCAACPMQKDCEYALHNGPSLHGRKRIKVSKASQGAFGGETTVGPDEDILMMPNSPLPGSNQLPPELNNSNKSIHWRTRQKLDRLAQEKAALELALAKHACLYSTIDLEELVSTRTTRPRSRGLRRPRGMSTDEDLVVSQLQRVEAEVRYKAGVASWQKMYPINWLNLDTLELGARGLLPASVWDHAVDMDMDQHAQKKSTQENNGDVAVAAAAAADGSSINERLAAWEEALRDASSTLQYPNRVANAADKALSSPLDLQQDLHLSIWDHAGNPPLPRRVLVQQQQFEVEPPGPPVVLKSKPVVHQGGKGEGEEAPALAVEIAGAGRGAFAIAAPATAGNGDNAAIDFIPPEGVSEIDIMTNDIAELLPELMSWMPPPELCVSLGASPVADAPLAAKIQQEDSIQHLEEASTLPNDAVALPIPQVKSCLSSPSHIELECQRLQQMAVELAAENEVLLKLDQGAAVIFHRKRLLELSLQALNFDLSVSVESAESVVTAARSNYRQLARALHPDKCQLPGAVDAFSGLSMAMRIVSEYSLEQEELEKDNGIKEESGGKPGFVAAAAAADSGGNFVQQNSSPTGGTSNPPTAPLEHRIVWNQSRLVVAAHILPSYVHSTFSHLHGATVDKRSGSDTVTDEEHQVMFLPLSNIPTFQREGLAGRRTMTTRSTTIAKATCGIVGGQVELVINGLLNAVCEGENEATRVEGRVDTATAIPGSLPADASAEGDDLVEGMLLVTCRAALRGRFPLNGTYFQINELFADHQTAVEAIKLSQSVLENTKTCAIYFGLGIHYMSKAMTQQEVAKMFSSDGWVCFRAFDPETRAPRLLPHFLMPSVPTASTSTWKNKTERAAIKAAKLATMAVKNGNTGYNNVTSNTNPLPQPQQQQWYNIPLQGTGTTATTTANDPLTPLAAPKRKKKNNHGIADSRFEPMFLTPSSLHGAFKGPKTPGNPMTQEAMDSKSGKGKSRRRTFGPIIKSSQKCGLCKPCLNPGWKKPCDVRRAEMLAKLQEEQNARHEQEQQQMQWQQMH